MASSALGFTLGNATNAVLDSYTYGVSILIGGVSAGAEILRDTLTLQLSLGKPSTLTFTMRVDTISPGGFDVVQIYQGSVAGGNAGLLFSGRVSAVRYVIREDSADQVPLAEITALDTSWYLNVRSTPVFGWWRTKGINTIVRDVLSDAVTAGTVSLGYLPASLGTLDAYEAAGSTVGQVLDELATLAGASWQVDVDDRLHMFTSPDHLGAPTFTIADGSENVRQFEVYSDTLEYANLVRVLGKATALRAAVTPSSLSLPILAWDAFNYTSGTVVVGGVDVLTYTGGTTVPGSETLVLSGGSAPSRDWPEGTTVAPLVDAGSGSYARLVPLPEANAAAAATVGATLRALYIAGTYEIRGMTVDLVHTGASRLVPGALVSVSLTAPIAMEYEGIVQSVTIRSLRVNGADRWERSFVAGPVWLYWQTFKQLMG